MASQTPPPLAPNALSALGLQRNPFAEQAELGFVFADAAHKTQLNVALQLLQASDRLLIVRGEAGIGKTAFLHGLAHRRLGGLHFCCIAGQAGWSFEVLLGRFISEAELVENGEQLSVHLAASRLSDSASAGERAVLLLDDAAALDDAVLERLLSLRAGGGAETAAFGLVLAASPEFDSRLERLKQVAPGADQLHVINLYPYAEQQSVDYLTQRLALAGDIACVNLSDAQMREIHLRAKGVPAALNAEASQLLAERATRLAGHASVRVRGGGRRLYLFVAVAVALLAGVLIAAVLTIGKAPAPVPLAVIGTPAAAPLSAEPAMLPADGALAVPADSQTAVAGVVAPGLAIAQAATDPAEPDPAARVLEPADRTAAAPVVEPPAVAPTIDIPPALAEPAGATAPSPATAPTLAVAEPATASAPTAAPSAVPAPAPAAELAVEAAAPGEPRGARWVLERSAHRYTVQIIAAHDRDMVLRYLDSHRLTARAALLRTERKGENWYVAILGDYADTAAAKAAIAELPAKLRATSPFVRRFEVLQQALR